MQGSCAEETAEKFGISRAQQDKHAILSYTRSANAVKNGWFRDEIVPVILKLKETVVSEDEEYKKVSFDKIPALKPVFKPTGGTVTAANASTLNDGASALVLMSGEKAKAMGLKPLARILCKLYC
jgi:acetyl-CoA C-acetyltransferase